MFWSGSTRQGLKRNGTVLGGHANITQVETASAQLFRELQDAVDRDIQQTGWLPGEAGSQNGHSNSNGHINGNGRLQSNGSNGKGVQWQCSTKQRDLILKIVDEHHLDKKDVEALAHERFDKSVTALNKLEASGLIDELIQNYSTKRNGNGNHNGRSAFGGNRR